MSFETTDLHTREQLLAMVFNQARDMMVLSKVDPQEVFRTVWLNQTYLEVVRSAGFDVSMTELEGRTFREIAERFAFAPRTVDELRERYREVARTGRRMDYEEVTETPAGVFYGESTITPLFDESGTCAYYLYSSRDVTQQRRAEVSRRESDSKFTTAFRLSPAAMMLADLGSGEILEVNESFERITGFARAEVLGKTAVGLGLIDNEKARVERAARLQREREILGERHRFRRKDGQWIESLGSAALVKIGGRACILNTVEDITERLRVEKERLDLERHLRQSQKLEALGTLSGGIAHDFNNILTALLANCELGLLDVDRAEDVQKRLEAIRRSGLRARDLVRRILAFSRQQVHERTSLLLDGLLLEVKSLLESSLPASIQVELEVPDEVPTVSGDGSQIHQVLLNLATNAGHAMQEKGGRLRLGLRFATLASEQTAEVGLSEPGEFAVITVADEGHGIAAEIQPRIFEPFFTTKAPGEGTGLGLAMVHGIVKDHDGAVTVDSREGEGTTVTVYLPVGRGVEPTRGLFDARLPQGDGQRLLVVDDEPGVGELMKRLLECIGYHVEACASAEAAWERIQAEPERFALLLTDLTMPGWNGLELTRRVHELRPDLPICLMSGYAGQMTREDLRRLGVREFIHKPPELSELAHRLHAAFHGEAPQNPG